MRIYLSPSSQFSNLYSFGGYNEAEVCGMIAERAYIALKRNDFEVKLGSIYTSMEYRTQESNEWGADYHVPIHTNAGGGEGTVVFASAVSANDQYVKEVYNALAAVSPGKDRNVTVNDGLYEINFTSAVCIYTETEFHDNVDLAKWIVENVEIVGEAFAKGFCAADGKVYKATDGTEEIEEKDKPSIPTEEKKKELGKVDVIYQAYTNRWWPVVKNNEDWAGKGDKVPLRFLAICVSKGKIRGRVHTIQDGWLPYLTFKDNYNLNDLNNGVLGNGNPIDAIELYYYTPEGYMYKKVAYRASDLNNETFFAIQYDDETSNGQDGYTGLFGVAIDKFQAWIV